MLTRNLLHDAWLVHGPLRPSPPTRPALEDPACRIGDVVLRRWSELGDLLQLPLLAQLALPRLAHGRRRRQAALAHGRRRGQAAIPNHGSEQAGGREEDACTNANSGTPQCLATAYLMWVRAQLGDLPPTTDCRTMLGNATGHGPL